MENLPLISPAQWQETILAGKPPSKSQAATRIMPILPEVTVFNPVNWPKVGLLRKIDGVIGVN
jgi:hypothetical protein